ncbi:MAG TPA: hypothetical protein VFO12_00225 [Sphingomicrobium sp.]|nr:hypothetical protein [Sphingomicrobium sp.]
MANEQDKNPTTGSESDISKAQSQQQPPQQSRQDLGESGQQAGQFETGQQAGSERTGDQAATGQAQSGAGPDEALQGETATQQRTDIEGGSLASDASGEAQSGFVGAQGQQDSSSELIEEEDEDFAKDGQGAPEGK